MRLAAIIRHARFPLAAILLAVIAALVATIVIVLNAATQPTFAGGKDHFFANETGQAANDLHVTFSSEVDFLNQSSPAGCPEPQVSQPDPDVIVLEWDIACVPHLESVRIQVNPTTATVVEVIWTLDGLPLTPTPSPSPSPSATPEATATPTAPAVERTLQVEPASGPMGASVTVTGAHWTPANVSPQYRLFWQSVGGPDLGTFAPNAQGSWSQQVTIPVGFPNGTYSIHACEGYGGESEVCLSMDFALLTPTISPPPGDQVVWGDNNCSGAADPVDALLTLRNDAGLSTNTGSCPAFGTPIALIASAQMTWGDVDCSGAADPVDALKILRFDAGLSAATGSCPALGTQVTIAVE